MNDNYILMHRDVPCAVIAIDRDNSALREVKIIRKDIAPFLGGADERRMKKWWEQRAVPGSRKDIARMLKNAGCTTNREYLAKNLALSLEDTYWICPVETELRWEDVNLFHNEPGDTEVLSFHNGSSYDPNASLGGEMDKYWDLAGKTPVLVKKAYENFGQQSINEAFASLIHRKQKADIPYAGYEVMRGEDNALIARCAAFTSENVEFVSAYEVIHSAKRRKDRSQVDHYIDVCEEHGLSRSEMQRYMDYLILSDFVISNTDEHLRNFGVLRDPKTMELLGPAPIFDSGNSMFWDVLRVKPLGKKELMARKINSINTKEGRMLEHVRNRDVLDPMNLPGPAEVEELYSSYGLPEERAAFIAGSYACKLSIFDEYISGKDISIYR